MLAPRIFVTPFRGLLHPNRLLSNLSVLTKLVLAFYAILAASVGAVVVLNTSITHDQLLNTVGANLKNQAVSQAASIGELLDEEVTTLRALALNDLLQQDIIHANASYSGDTATIESHIQTLNMQWVTSRPDAAFINSYLTNEVASELKSYQHRFPNNGDMLITDQYGTLVAATTRVARLSYGHESWWQTTWNNKAYIGEPILDTNKPTYDIPIAIPIYDDQSQPIGVLYTHYSMEAITDLIHFVHLGKTGNAHLLLPGGWLLKGNGLGKSSLQLVDSAQLTQLAASKQTNYAEIPMDGAVNLVSQAPVVTTEDDDMVDTLVANLGWVLIISQGRAESLTPLTLSGQITVVVSLVILLISTLLAFILSKGLSAPIRQLTRIAQQISEGDLSQRIAFQQRDEIGQLAHSFNVMIDTIQERNAELTRFASSLGDQVEQRTAALWQANQALQQEIVERGRIEQALYKSEEHLRQITDNMLDILYQTDPAGIIEYASPSCAATTGYQPEQMIGQSIFASIHPADVEAVREAIQTSGNVQYRSRHANGEYLWLETLGNLLLAEDGTITGMILATRDISIRKKAEQELEDLNRIKTEFLSTAAHELRTPLTSVRGFTELLLTRTLDQERHERFLRLINEQATQLGQLIDDLLDISRLESKRNLALNLESVNLSELLTQVVIPFSESAMPSQIELKNITDSPLVMADSFRVGQVLKNLISNAIKYSPQGGAITIWGEVLGNAVQISIQDHGMGMTPEQQAHLFEKFYRANSSNTDIPGTGLGLAISKLIVELHGGTISAESQLGVGTTFRFTLPIAKAELERAA